MKIALSLVLAALAVGCSVESSSDEASQPAQAEEISTSAAELKISQVTIPKWEPFETEGFSTCNNEAYAFKGKMLNWTQTTTDRKGGTHVLSILAIKGTGVGADTGAKYVTFEAGFTAENYFASGVQDIFSVFHGRLKTPDPKVQDEQYDLLFHLHIEADGTVTSSIDKFTTTCR